MINIIAAFSLNRVIGCSGRIPWDLPEDMKRFRMLTLNNVVVMGRKTFQEIGKPLPNRFNIIISSANTYSGENIVTASSLEEAIKNASRRFPEKEIFLCGGQQIYQEGMAWAQRLFLTEISVNVHGDAFFPPIPNDFALISKETVHGSILHNNLLYERVSPPKNQLT